MLLTISTIAVATWLVAIVIAYALVFNYVFLRAHKAGTNCPSCLYEFTVHAGWRAVLQAGTPAAILVWLCLIRFNIFPDASYDLVACAATCLCGLVVGAHIVWYVMGRRMDAMRNALNMPSIELSPETLAECHGFQRGIDLHEGEAYWVRVKREREGGKDGELTCMIGVVDGCEICYTDGTTNTIEWLREVQAGFRPAPKPPYKEASVKTFREEKK